MKAENLRKSILQMAIQGKLVPQNPNDEPASVLLERIRAEKQKLIKEGKIKKDKNDSIIFKGDDNCYYEKIGNQIVNITDDIPFELPNNWEWTRLQDLAEISAGGTPDRSVPEYWLNGNIPWLKISDITSADKYVNKATEYITEKGVINSSAKIFHSGTILYTIFATIGEVGILTFDSTTNQAIAGIQTFLLDINSYLYYYLVNLQDYMKSISKGCAQFNINQKILKTALVPIPPLDEQVRIVNKIVSFEPLLAEYDKLEQQATKLDDEIYDNLKKSILQYAIQGKLVAQDSNDEPASVLLAKIREEKKKQLGKKYVDSYIYKGDDNCYYEHINGKDTNITDDIPFDLPNNWQWCRLSSICSYIHRGKSPNYGLEKKLPIIAQKCNQWSGLQIDKCLFSSVESIKKYTAEQFLKVDDIIINSTGTGTVGRTGQINKEIFSYYEKYVADSHVTVVRCFNNINSKYIFYYLKSPQIQFGIEERCSGSTNQIELATTTILQYLIPIPPLEEQKRIVDRINEIFEKL